MTIYHVSYTYLGDKIKLTPRVPPTAGPKEDQTTPRICFAPSVIKCLHAIEGTKDSKRLRAMWELSKKNPSVYYTKRLKSIVPAGKVPDKKFTEEVWVLRPITVYFSGFIDIPHFVRTGKIQFTNTLKTEAW